MIRSYSRQALQTAGTAAVKWLRKEKLSNGQPFMINSKSLPKGQSYLEFPNGQVKLVSISSSKRDFNVIKEYSPEESLMILKSFHLK